MKTSKYIKKIRSSGNFGSKNAEQIVLAIGDLDESLQQIKIALKEIPKQLKYFWQTMEELKDEKKASLGEELSK
jgi:hypothetical protein